MAKHRIRRWFQSGVLDLRMLTPVVAAGVALCRPAPAKTHKAAPWVVGLWTTRPGARGGDPLTLGLLPDGCYNCYSADQDAGWQFRWTMSAWGAARDAF